MDPWLNEYERLTQVASEISANIKEIHAQVWLIILIIIMLFDYYMLFFILSFSFKFFSIMKMSI